MKMTITYDIYPYIGSISIFFGIYMVFAYLLPERVYTDGSWFYVAFGATNLVVYALCTLFKSITVKIEKS